MNADSWQLSSNEVRAVERDDEGLAYLWLAKKSPQEIRYLTLTRFEGADDVYVERDDQAWSCHNGIERVELRPDGLTIQLNANGQSHLGGMTELNVTFATDVKQSFGNIERVLQILFSNGVVSVSM